MRKFILMSLVLMFSLQSCKNASKKTTTDASTDASAFQTEYGTTIPMNTEIAVKADTSGSIVLDVRNEARLKATNSGYTKKEGIIYKKTTYTDGNHKGMSLDLKMEVLYHPEAKEKSPCVLIIPGGGFVICPLECMPVAQDYLAKEGFAVVSAEYHVIGQGTYKDAVADANDAIRYVKAHAEEYNIDPDRIALMGNSAGGYMVALTSLSKGVETFKGTDNLTFSEDVNCVIDLYGLSDLTKVADDYPEKVREAHVLATSNESQFVNGVFSKKGILEDKDSAKKSNPITYVRKDVPPFLILHGDNDHVVSPSQTVLLHKALLSSGAKSTRYSLVGADHGDDNFDTTTVLDIIVKFIRSNM